MKLKVLSLPDVEQVRQWRNQQIEMLRTPFLLTWEQQEKFYHDVICNRQANARYWGIWLDGCGLIGMCGLENIQWENRLAEISLIFNPGQTMDGVSKEMALNLLLHEGFMNMNLENIYIEVYDCNPYKEFWIRAIGNCTDDGTIDYYVLPNRKYYNGCYFNSKYYNISKERYNENIIS